MGYGVCLQRVGDTTLILSPAGDTRVVARIGNFSGATLARRMRLMRERLIVHNGKATCGDKGRNGGAVCHKIIHLGRADETHFITKVHARRGPGSLPYLRV
jgi:hypothetical protein